MVHSTEKLNFTEINKSLEEVDWIALKAAASVESFPVLFNQTVLEICQKHCPKKVTINPKQSKRKSTHSRHLHALNRKKRRLKG